MPKDQTSVLPDPKLSCPNCGKDIRLTESLAAPLIEQTKNHYKQILAQKDEEAVRREAQVQQKENELERQREILDQTIADKLKAERLKVEDAARKSAERTFKEELEARDRRQADLEQLVNDKELKLKEARKAQENALKLQRELEQARAELSLEVQKQVNAQVAEARKQARQDLSEEFSLKLKEKDILLEQMKETIEELKQKSEQRSQELQGEAQEQRLLEILQLQCHDDEFSDVGRGEHGADIIQEVRLGADLCGTILWESKRTKNWQSSWLPKLRKDQRERKADVAVIVSQQLPDQVESFGLVDEVWVVHWRYVTPFILMLRRSLVEVARSRQAREGQQTKMELIYDYLTGPNFRRRVEAIIEAFSTMQDDLDKERKAIERIWAKRKVQIENVMIATAGMYGDFQGIAGKSLQELDGLDLPTLPGPQDE